MYRAIDSRASQGVPVHDLARSVPGLNDSQLPDLAGQSLKELGRFQGRDGNFVGLIRSVLFHRITLTSGEIESVGGCLRQLQEAGEPRVLGRVAPFIGSVGVLLFTSKEISSVNRYTWLPSGRHSDLGLRQS